MKACLFALCLLAAGAAAAHHSYAMFDGSKVFTAKRTVARLEWRNPHVYVWIYVPDSQEKSGYALYAFENGSPNVLTRIGWTSATLAVGEKISVDYWPLRDGRHGGHFIKAIRASGQVLEGAGGPGTDGTLRLPAGATQ